MYQFHLTSEHLTDGQREHVEEIAREFVHEMTEKYIAGQREHGGNLYDMSVGGLLDEAIKEAIDQVTYLLTIRRKLRYMRGYQKREQGISGV